MPNLTKVQTSDETLNRVQTNIQQALSQITGPFVGGRLISNVSLIAGKSNVINHGLAAQPQIWILCDLSATSGPSLSMNSYTPAGTISGTTFTGTPATLNGTVSGPMVWRTAWDSNSITLQCAANCSVSIWVNNAT